jgi:hypothetical protein
MGSNKVTLSGASLPSNIGIGDKLTMGGETFYIVSRDSASQVTLSGTASLLDHTRDSYTIERAYNTFADWESNRQGNLVGDNRREVGVAYSDGVLTPSDDILISGSTTDANHYMMITVAEGHRHTGVAGTGVVVDGAGVTEDVFRVQDEYTVIEWLEIKNYSGSTADGIVVDDSIPGTGTTLRNLIIHGYDTGDNAIRVQSDATIQNTIIYDGQDGILMESGAAATLENVTIYGMVGDGVNAPATAGAVTIRNVISVGNGGQDFEIASAISYFGNNMYSTTLSFDPASYQGANQSPPASLDDLFISIAAGTEDLHLETCAPGAINTGLDLSGSFAGDIDAETRSVPWDIGADEHEGPPTDLAHFKIMHDGTAVNCQAEDITITAHNCAEEIATSYTGTIDLSTTTWHGDWSVVSAAGSLTNSGRGNGTYSFAAADDGEVVLGLRDTYSETTNIDVADQRGSRPHLYEYGVQLACGRVEELDRRADRGQVLGRGSRRPDHRARGDPDE